MYEIVGIEETFFKDRESGREFRGTRLHTTYTKNNIEGVAVESFYCNSSVDIEGLMLGDLCEIFYNKYGKVSQIRKVS